MRGHRDLRIVTAAAPLCALVALVVPFEAVRVLFAAPLALLLPGYGIAAATFARRHLLWSQLMLISLSLSLATLAVGSVVLNYAPGGIRSISWALLLLIVIIGTCRAAALRRPQPEDQPVWRLPRIGRASAGLLLGGLLAAAAAVVLAGTTLPAKNALGYTQLWVLPEGGAETSEVQVGVGNQEQHAVAYDLLIRVGKAPLVRRSFTLTPGETSVVRVPAGTEADGAPVPVVASLLRQSQIDRVYRRVKSWLPAAESSR